MVSPSDFQAHSEFHKAPCGNSHSGAQSSAKRCSEDCIGVDIFSGGGPVIPRLKLVRRARDRDFRSSLPWLSLW